MTEIKIKVKHPTKGQFIVPVFMPSDTPEFLVGDRAIWRRNIEFAEGYGGMLMAWGDSTSFNGDVITLTPGPKMQEIVFPGYEGIHEILNNAYAEFSDDRSDGIKWTHKRSDAGNTYKAVVQLANRRVDLEYFQGWMSPFGLLMWVVARKKLTADDASSRGSLYIPGLCKLELRDGVPGQNIRGSTPVYLDNLDLTNPETRLAIENRHYIKSYGLPVKRPDTFIGFPTTKGFRTLADAVRHAAALSPKKMANGTGVDGSYGCQISSCLWTEEGPSVDSIPEIMRAATQCLERREGFITANGEEVEPYPSRRQFTFHNSVPWIDGRNDPYDPLEFPIPRGGKWPTLDGVTGPDNQHVTGILSSAAALLTQDLGYRLNSLRSALCLTYTRSYVITLSGQDWTPSGRGAARPGISLINHGSVSKSLREMTNKICLLWISCLLRKIRSRNIPRTMPCHYGALDSGKLAGYEEMQIAIFAIGVYRLTGNREALELAYLVSRNASTTFHYSQNPISGMEWTAAYFYTPNPDGSPRLLSQGEIEFAGEWMQRWSTSCGRIFPSVCLEMKRLGIAGDSGDQFWINVALQAEVGIRNNAAEESVVEENAYMNMTLPDVAFAQFAPIVPVG